MITSHPHFVCFAPYTDWSIHSARQVSILHALGQRNATFSYVTCDGVFSDCDLFQKATGAVHGRQPNSCLVCQASVASRLAAWSMPYRWLGTWLSTQDRTDVGLWLANVSPQDYPTVRFHNWDLGAWVKSSVRTHLRCADMNMEDDTTASTYASYLYSGALAALALDRLFDEEKPEAQLLFNGRMAPTRIALEVAKQKGIRTIVEERSAVAGRLILFEDVNCLDTSHIEQLWTDWKNVPLLECEINELAAVLADRRDGGKGEVSVFSQGQQPKEDVRASLGLETKKTVWVLFTSSVDEIADKENLNSVFPHQQDWIDSTIAFATNNPDIELVIRVHPNVGGDRALGENTEEVAYFQDLAKNTPENVTIVQPGDDVSSYTLIEICDLALVWYSTIGIEAAVMGRPVVRASGFMLETCGFIEAPDSSAAYPAFLEHYKKPLSSNEILDKTVAAWRFAYVWFLRRTIPFPIVTQPEWYIGEPAWRSPADLAPGHDPSLDRICDVFLSEAPIHTSPESRDSDAGRVERKSIRSLMNDFAEQEGVP